MVNITVKRVPLNDDATSTRRRTDAPRLEDVLYVCRGTARVQRNGAAGGSVSRQAAGTGGYANVIGPYGISQWQCKPGGIMRPVIGHNVSFSRELFIERIGSQNALTSAKTPRDVINIRFVTLSAVIA